MKHPIEGVLLATILAAACVHSPAPAASPMASTAGQLDTLASIRWTRSSAEHEALFREVYRAATTELERMLAASPPTRPWGVIMDADETIFDNSQYEQERAVLGKGFESASWDAWVRREAATALPGVLPFTQRVHALGGRVMVVTNRSESQCDPTRDNFRRIHFDADRVLCAPPNVSDKNPRFDLVRDSLQVLMWFGDNIQDFPKLSQSIRTAADSAFAGFGHTFFIVPNPMYGSWSNARLP